MKNNHIIYITLMTLALISQPLHAGGPEGRKADDSSTERPGEKESLPPIRPNSLQYSYDAAGNRTRQIYFEYLPDHPLVRYQQTREVPYNDAVASVPDKGRGVSKKEEHDES